MISLLIAAVLSASASRGGYPAVHPHIIRDATDAVLTACENMRANTPPAYVQYHKDCEKEFRARRVGNIWFIRQIMATADDPRGTFIQLDARDGHTISQVARD